MVCSCGARISIQSKDVSTLRISKLKSNFCFIYSPLKNLLSLFELQYVVGIFFVQFYTGVAHEIVFGDKLQFLPLMITSLYCGIGIVYGWSYFMITFLFKA